MTTLELLTAEETAANVRITDERGRYCDVRVWIDGSREAIGGARWMLGAIIKNSRDKAAFIAAVGRARQDGRATL